MKQTIQEYESYLVSEEKSAATVKKYTRDVQRFFEWLGERQLCKNKV